MRLSWAAAAEADLDDIVRYIAFDNVTAAFGVEDRIRQAVEHLRDLPESGRPGFKPGTRELVISRTPYLVTYRLSGAVIEILHITHGRRQVTPGMILPQ